MRYSLFGLNYQSIDDRLYFQVTIRVPMFGKYAGTVKRKGFWRQREK